MSPRCRYHGNRRAAIITTVGAYCADCANDRLADDIREIP